MKIHLQLPDLPEAVGGTKMLKAGRSQRLGRNIDCSSAVRLVFKASTILDIVPAFARQKVYFFNADPVAITREQ